MFTQKILRTLILTAFFTIVFFVPAAFPEQQIEWRNSFGGSESDTGSSVEQTSEGGYIFSGTTSSSGAGSSDVWLVKTDSVGKEQWSKTFGGIDTDIGRSVKQTLDGGYIIAGATRSYGMGNRDVWLIKTAPDGAEQWKKTFGGPGWDYGRSVQQTSDGGYIIAGYTDSFGVRTYDVWLIKTDQTGTFIWQKTFGGMLRDYGYAVQQTSDGGYIIVGETSSFGAGVYDIWLIKTDKDGNEQWNKTFGGTGNDRGRSVRETSDGGFILAGYTASFGSGLDDIWLIKTDKDGNEQWNKTFGGTGIDRGRCVDQTSDGGYVIAGYTSSFGSGLDDMWVVKTDTNGNEEWNWTFGGSLFYDKSDFIRETDDKRLVILGQSRKLATNDYETLLIKLRYIH